MATPETKECSLCGEWYEYVPHVCMGGRMKKRLVRIAFYQEVPEDAKEEEIVAWAKYELHQICELRLDNKLSDLELSAKNTVVTLY